MMSSSPSPSPSLSAGAGEPDERRGSAAGTGGDPTRVSHWRPLRLLLDRMDADIARLYAERGLERVRPRFVLPLLRLHHDGPLTIRALADSLEVTHSAASQTVSALRREGLVRSGPGPDGRSRSIGLTDEARELVPILEAEWLATERAVAELEEEVPYPLTRVVRDLEEALDRRSFRDRVAAHLPADTHPTGVQRSERG